MTEQGNNQNDPGTRWARLSRTASFWVFLVLMSILAVQFVRGSEESATEFTYTEFREQLGADNIHEVTVIEGRSIEGQLRAPVVRDGGEAVEFTTMLPGDIDAPLLSEMEDKGVLISAEAETTGWGTFLLGALPWLLFIAFWIWIFRTMQGGGNKAFQFGRSKAKMISPDTPKVTFADVAGADEAKDELQEIIEFLKDPQRFSRLGGRLPKGVLLVGPPGTGKTLLAKAVAGEAARPFFQMSGSDFVEMFVGVGASRVRDLFEQGKAHAPCIIFIDEIDAVGRHRGAGLGGGHDEREQTLNALLVEMDGFESNEGVILLAATNRPDVLDPALLRPGRFDRQVVVDSPDVRGREGILRVHAKKLPLADDVELSLVARGTPGLSGADLANVCNEAALLAAREGADRVAMDHFERAKDKVMLGTERRSLVLTETERTLTAYHEAGHAVIGLRLPGLDPVHKVTIVPRGRALGITASLPVEDRHSYTKEWLEGQLVMLFGGRVAEEMIFGPEKITTGAGNDIDRATQMARRMVTTFGMSEVIGLVSVGDAEHEVFLGRELVQRRSVSEHTARQVDEEVKRFVDVAHDRARDLLDQNRSLLEDIAQALLDRETLDRDEIELLAEGKPLPPLDTGPSLEAEDHAAPLSGAGIGPSVSPTTQTELEMGGAEDADAPSQEQEGEPSGSVGAPVRLSPETPEADPDSLMSEAPPTSGPPPTPGTAVPPTGGPLSWHDRDVDPQWRLRDRSVSLGAPVVVGIVNLTPDSFSDGGAWPTLEIALSAAERMVADGAALLDVGGESTRPGADPVAAVEELARILPFLRAALERFDVPITVDTRKAEVAEAALEAGAHGVNDVSGLHHEGRLADVVAAFGGGLVLMHMRGEPVTMGSHASYGDVVEEVCAELADSLGRAIEAGVEPNGIVVDPGLGFAKTPAQSLELIRDLHRLADLGYPLMVGPSRKSFLGAVLGLPPDERVEGTVAASVAAYLAGARIFRVHDVRAVFRALQVAHAIRHPEGVA